MQNIRISLVGTVLALCGLLFWQCKDDDEKKTGSLVERLAFLQEEVVLKEGDNEDLEDLLIIEPEEMIDSVEYASSNKEIAIVTSSGKLLALYEGRCTVTASACGKTAVIEVRVTPLPINGFDVPTSTVEASVNVPVALGITVTPAKASPGHLTLSVVGSDKGSVKFEEGAWKFTATEAGTYTVSVKNGETVKTITVDAKVKPVESVSLNKTSTIIAIDGAVTLSATVYPDDATYKTVEWTSTDNTIATVDENGVCHGLKKGKVTITATAVGGENASCTLIVTDEDLSKLHLFSTGDKLIRFAPGNLQYTTIGTHNCADGTTKTGTWRFAQRQYDYIGTGNSNMSSTYSGWVDLFGWGATGYVIYPYTTSTTDSYGNTADEYSDWGRYNAIQNGSVIDEPGTWRTPNMSDFYYILNSRANAANLYGVAQVCGVNGLVLLPDDWPFPAGLQFTSGVASSNGEDFYQTVNKYNQDQWQQMEDYGAVFLPAAGYRTSTNLYSQSVEGCYWTVTSYNYYGNIRMVRLWFSSKNVECLRNYDGTRPREYGYSVRLVQDF